MESHQMAHRNVKTSKMRGVDPVACVWLLTSLDYFVTPSLIGIFNTSRLASVVPSVWRPKIIFHLFKTGVKEFCSNGRPAIFAFTVSKVFERLFKGKLEDYLQDHSILQPWQCEFVPKQSCLSKRSAQDMLVTALIYNKKDVDVVFLDFTKAFDSVNHRLRDLIDRVEAGISFASSATTPSSESKSPVIGHFNLSSILMISLVLCTLSIIFDDDVKPVDDIFRFVQD